MRSALYEVAGAVNNLVNDIALADAACKRLAEQLNAELITVSDDVDEARMIDNALATAGS